VAINGRDAVSDGQVSTSREGLARLPIAAVVAFLSFLCQALLHYLLPLYLSAKGLPSSAWETWSYYEIVAWLFAPPLAGVLGARVGERRTWAAGLAGYVTVGIGISLIRSHSSWTDPALSAIGLLWGISSAMIWVGGISLVQRVTDRQRGLSNAVMMTSLGAGSIGGPLLGRALMQWREVPGTVSTGDFSIALAGFATLALLGATLMLGFGEYRSSRQQTASATTGARSGPLRRSLALFRFPKYVLLVFSLSLLGGPVFQAANVYRPYRVRDPQIGLIIGSQDHGWAALEITGYVMQLTGGLLIGLIAGRKKSGWIPALVLGGFAACGLGIGLAPNAVVLFAFSAVFELLRQFMRWIQTGYISEYVSEDQRSLAIGFSVTVSGIGSWAFNLLVRLIQSPDSPGFSSGLPFQVAATLGFFGTILLVAWQLRLSNSGGNDVSA
jgi:MFS family permease